jgi:DNA-binding XRE family transcriptional regulator
MVSGRMPNPGRRQQMATLREQGLSFGEIGRRLGVGGPYVRYALTRLMTPPPPGRCCICDAELTSPVALAREKDLLCLTCLARRPRTPFGQMLKAFRVAAGWTQQQLARHSGVTAESINAFERGHRLPRITTLGKLFRVLGVCWTLTPPQRRTGS